MPPEIAGVAAPRFQFIYLIHGDAGYGYFGADGKRRFADAEAVAQAMEVAGNSPDAEVFIFHRKPGSFLGLFRKRDGRMLHFRQGRKLATREYRIRGSGEDDFSEEAALFGRHRSKDASAAKRFLFFFGHEIPVTAQVPYSRSRPGMGFSVAAFARGLGLFAGPSREGGKPFSLVALSSCHGGTPATIRAVAPYADHIVASPGELHLSYLDTRVLARLSRDGRPFGTAQAETWGQAIAESSFAGLCARTVTQVTVALYDGAKASMFLDARRGSWSGEMPQRALDPPSAFPAYRDCAADPSFGSRDPVAGVTVYYRPPRFGPDKGRVAHSGWECPVPAAMSLGLSP